MSIFDQIREALYEHQHLRYATTGHKPNLAVLVGYEAFDELVIDVRFTDLYKTSDIREDLTFDGRPLHRVISTKLRFQIVEVLS